MFYDNLKTACEKSGVKMTPTIIECGGTKGVISGWKNGAAPNSDIVIKLAVRLNVSTDYLLTGEIIDAPKISDDSKELLDCYEALDGRGKTIVKAASYHELDRLMESKKKKQGKIINFKTIEPINYEQDNTVTRSFVVYDMPASAGTGLFLDSADYHQVDLPQEVIPTKANFAVKISGDSMLPKISDGDIVFVNQTQELDNGDIGIFTLNGSAYCKRLLYKNDYTYLESLNKEYAPIELKEGDDLRVVGKVVGVGKL